jgi:hypothetical protein
LIIAYAQAADKQGVDAASNGRTVSPKEASFVALREKATDLNFSTSPHRVGNAEVRYGNKIVRIEIVDNAEGSLNVSPVVLVASIADLLGGIDLATRLAADSVSAIGRTVDSASIAAGFEEGERLHRSFRTRRYVAAAVAVTLVAGVVIWLSRGASGPWSR